MTAAPTPTPARWAALLVEPLLAAPLAVLLAVVVVATVGADPRCIPALFVAAATPALCSSDVLERRLPNRIVLPGLVVAAGSAAGVWLAYGEPPVVALLSGAGYFTFLFALGLAGGMGMGDVKLGGVLGLAAGLLGPSAAVLSPVLAFTAGGVGGVIALMLRARSIPFGPFMLGGFWAAVALCGLGRALG
ncbi:MAG: prepilin peptidase [Rhodoglobus sp.]|nr:prepilin peptidase [Rhodoglobus sp.]